MKRYLLLAAVFIMLIPKTAFALADSAECACVMNALTGEVIFEKNAYERRPMASTTKIMTALAALEESGSDEIVKVSSSAANQEGSSAYLGAGSEIYMDDLLYGLMLNSGNDAAEAVAEHIAGSSEAFAEIMNEKAREIGAYDTSFANPSGLDAPEHYTTARDLALITRRALQNPEFREIVSTREILKHPINSDKELWFINHNKLLKSYEGCIGVKTGYTKTAGRCLVSAAERDGMTFIAVTLKDTNDWSDHMEMLDYAFSKYSPKEIISAGQCIKTAFFGKEKLSFLAANSFVIPYREGKMSEVRMETRLPAELTAPVNAGEKIGCINIFYGGEYIGNVDIISENDIYGSVDLQLRNSFFDVFISVLKSYCI